MFDVVSLLKERGVGFRELGNNELELTCPICGKKNHGYLNVAKGVFFCQKCKYGANILYFLMIQFGISKEKASRLIFGEKDRSISGLKKRIDFLSKESVLKDFSTENLFFKNPLPGDLAKITRKHYPKILVERKVSFETIRKFKVLLCDSSNLGKYSNRLIVPVTTLQTKTFTAVTAFPRRQVRNLKAIYKAKGQKFRKSLFPFGSFMSEVLFNYDRIKNSSGDLFVVEGFWDVLRLYREGLGAVGTFGSKLSFRQAELLSETNSSRIFLMLDGDVSIENLMEDFLLLSTICFDKEVLLCTLPDKKDPDDISREMLFKKVKQAEQGSFIRSVRFANKLKALKGA